MPLIELGLRQFDEFAFKHEYRSYYQTTQYGTLMSKHGYNAKYLGLTDRDGVVKAAALLLIKSQFGSFKTAYSPRGFLIDFNDRVMLSAFTKAIKKYMESKNIISLTIDPHVTHIERGANGAPIQGQNNGVSICESLKELGYEHKGFNLYFENQKPRWNMVLKTDKTPIEVFNLFNKETRTKVRNSLRKGVEVYKGTSSDMKMFYQMISKKQHRRFDYYMHMYNIFSKFDMFELYFARINTEVYLRNSKLLYEHELQRNSKLANDLQKHFKDPRDKNKVLNKKIASDKLLSVYKSDMDYATRLFSQHKYFTIACNAIIKYGNEIFFLIDGIHPRYKKFNGNHLLKWKIIEEYRKLGFTKFHLNGITGDFNKKNKYLGLYTFKKGFGTNITEYIGEFELIANRPKYNLYKSLSPIFRNKKDI